MLPYSTIHITLFTVLWKRKRNSYWSIYSIYNNCHRPDMLYALQKLYSLKITYIFIHNTHFFEIWADLYEQLSMKAFRNPWHTCTTQCICARQKEPTKNGAHYDESVPHAHAHTRPSHDHYYQPLSSGGGGGVVWRRALRITYWPKPVSVFGKPFESITCVCTRTRTVEAWPKYTLQLLR